MEDIGDTAPSPITFKVQTRIGTSLASRISSGSVVNNNSPVFRDTYFYLRLASSPTKATSIVGLHQLHPSSSYHVMIRLLSYVEVLGQMAAELQSKKTKINQLTRDMLTMEQRLNSETLAFAGGFHIRDSLLVGASVIKEVAEGARLCGGKRIIGVDLNQDKFEIEKKFGVTDSVNPRNMRYKAVSRVILYIMLHMFLEAGDN
ncbi:unnamed protein product [Lactuca saligna]|uniref:Uncharacterized protein n=1 Tax=Lactuca saligna TaxID=75948 RepID=A0AA35ZNI7_LACSI|nr:unnamed protein product [Lactuca saligna]